MNLGSIALCISALIYLLLKAILPFQYNWKPTLLMTEYSSVFTEGSLKLIFMVLKLIGNAKYIPPKIAIIWWERDVAVSYKCLKNILKLIFWKKGKDSRQFTKVRYILKCSLAVANQNTLTTCLPSHLPPPWRRNSQQIIWINQSRT